MGVVKFRVTRARPSLLAGIVEVEGRTGLWPLQRPVHYRVGANCDSIRTEGGKLIVLLGTSVIAEAKYAARPTPAASDLQWENLLQPRDRHGR